MCYFAFFDAVAEREDDVVATGDFVGVRAAVPERVPDRDAVAVCDGGRVGVADRVGVRVAVDVRLGGGTLVGARDGDGVIGGVRVLDDVANGVGARMCVLTGATTTPR